MKQRSTYSSVLRAGKWLIAIAVIWQISASSALLAQCSGFWTSVDTDPPYLTYCPGDTVSVFPIITGGTSPFTYQWSSGGTDSIDVVAALEIGWYNACVTITDANGCVAFGCKHIKPTFWNLDIWSGGTACPGASVQLSVNAGSPTTFLWSTGEDTNPIYVTDPGIYTVTVTDPQYGCVQVLDVEPAFLPLPVPEISGPSALCNGQTATLEITNASGFSGFAWSSGESNAQIAIQDPGTYTVTVTDFNGCTGTSEIAVEQLQGTLPELSAPPQLCAEDVGQIEVTNAGDLASFSWSTGETTASIEGQAPETYWVTVTDAGGCTETGEVTIALFEVVEPTIVGHAEICVGQESATFSVEQSFVQYLWSTGATTQSIEVTDADLYTVTVTDANGCTTTGEHDLISAPIPDPFIQTPPLTCDSVPALLTVFGDGGPYVSYLWSPNSETDSEIIVYESGTFSVLVTNEYGCTGTSAEETIIINGGPDATISTSQLQCDGSATLTAGGGVSYLWSTGATSETISVENSDVYRVTVTDENGCTATAEEVVEITGALVFEISGPPEICGGQSVVLGATPGFEGYLWSTGDVTAQIEVSGADTYTVTVTDASGCTGVESLDIVMSPTPAPEITGPPGFCTGGSAVLSLAESGGQILWSTGEATTDITVAEPGSYTVTVTSAAGCTGEASWEIEEYPEAIVEIQGPLTMCEGSSAQLQLSGTYNAIIWSTGENTPGITVSSSGLYEVTVTDYNGCMATAEHVIETDSALNPVIVVTGPACSDTVILDAGSGYDTYEWSTGATTPTIAVSDAGTYSVTVVDAGGCSGESAAEVALQAPAEIAIAGPPSACAGDATELTADGGFVSYRWSTGDTMQSITVSESGTYSLVATDVNGCIAEAGFFFESLPLPVAGIAGPPVICEGSTSVLAVSGDYDQVTWSTGHNGPELTVSEAGVYGVTVTDINGCTAAAQHEVEVADSLSPEITINGSPCSGVVLLDAGNGYNTYVWSNGMTSREISVTEPGSYSVTVTEPGGCSGVGIIDFTLPDPLQVSIAGPTSACASEQAMLAVSPAFASYYWSTGDTTESITVSATGNYAVTVTDANGCEADTSVFFQSFTPPDVEINGPSVLCSGETGVLHISGGFTGIIWSTGGLGDSTSVTGGGMYAVTVTDANGCTASAVHEVADGLSDSTWLVLETCSVLDTGIVQYALANASGCDSIVTVRTTLVPALASTVTMSACPGESVMFDGVEINAGKSREFVYTASSGCDSLIEVVVEALPPLLIDLATDPTCQGEENGVIEVFVVEGIAPCAFAMDGGPPTDDSVFFDLSGGAHKIVVADANGCTVEQNIDVPVMVVPEVVVQDQVLSCQQPSVMLEPLVVGANASEMAWLWDNGSTQHTREVGQPGPYTVSVDDGCQVRDYAIEVTRDQELRSEDLFYIPNVFSPNQDGTNDMFRIFPTSEANIVEFEFRVFDRWGNQLFVTNDVEDGWDGRFGDTQMEPGVYVWYVRTSLDLCGMRRDDVFRRGDVTIVR